MNEASYKKFFRAPTSADKLDLFQTLSDLNEINPDLAFALLKIVHAELSAAQGEDSAYKQYAKTIAFLRHRRGEMLRYVSDIWDAERTAELPDWLKDGVIK
ncbi:MAG: hypothetical protein LC099_05990 [Anaerolineales bacterium]|nr:hypothetical protein [Anaerolineales bacterium]